MTTAIGSVTALRRYPVKTMQGEELEESWADERGLLGDRFLAVIDVETGHVANAKNPRLWRRLLDCKATYETAPERARALPRVLIRLPNGTVVTSDDPSAADHLSELVGRRVRLSQRVSSLQDILPGLDRLSPEHDRDTLTGEALTALAPDGSFVEPTVFHVLATQTLEPSKLRALDTQIESARFRANVEIGTDPHEPAALEDAWVGGVLRVGADVSMKIQMATMRGELTTLPNDLAVDPRVLRSLVLANLVELPGQFPSIGAYASLARDLSGGGWIRRGDPCLLDRS